MMIVVEIEPVGKKHSLFSIVYWVAGGSFTCVCACVLGLFVGCAAVD